MLATVSIISVKSVLYSGVIIGANSLINRLLIHHSVPTTKFDGLKILKNTNIKVYEPKENKLSKQICKYITWRNYNIPKIYTNENRIMVNEDTTEEDFNKKLISIKHNIAFKSAAIFGITMATTIQCLDIGYAELPFILLVSVGSSIAMEKYYTQLNKL